MTLEIDRRLLRTIEQTAIEAYPEECCGLLIGRDGDPRVVLQSPSIRNVDEGDRRRRYTMDPQATFDAFRAAQAGGNAVLGFFHSHPDGTSQPSAHDIESAWPDKSYLIVGIAGDRITSVRAWRLDATNKAMTEEPLRLTSDPPLQ